MQSKPSLRSGFDVIIRPAPEQTGHYSHFNTVIIPILTWNSQIRDISSKFVPQAKLWRHNDLIYARRLTMTLVSTTSHCSKRYVSESLQHCTHVYRSRQQRAMKIWFFDTGILWITRLSLSVYAQYLRKCYHADKCLFLVCQPNEVLLNIFWGVYDVLIVNMNKNSIGLWWRSCEPIEIFHDGVIKWKHFLSYWFFVRGIHQSPGDSPHQGQLRRVLMFSLICDWRVVEQNVWDGGDLRRIDVHCDVTVMQSSTLGLFQYHHFALPIYMNSHCEYKAGTRSPYIPLVIIEVPWSHGKIVQPSYIRDDSSMSC